MRLFNITDGTDVAVISDGTRVPLGFTYDTQDEDVQAIMDALSAAGCKIDGNTDLDCYSDPAGDTVLVGYLEN